MMNTRLIEDAVKLVVELFEYEGISESTATITERATDWYNHTDITNDEMLAAVTIYGKYNSSLSWPELEKIKEFYFPSCPIEADHFHIGEIEMAQADMEWM